MDGENAMLYLCYPGGSRFNSFTSTFFIVTLLSTVSVTDGVDLQSDKMILA